MSISGRLQRCLVRRRHCIVEDDGDRTTFGFVLGIGPALVLLQRFNDFTNVGYVLLRPQGILEIEFGTPNLEFFESMMDREGVRVGIDAPPPLTSLHEALAGLSARGFVLVEDGARDQHSDSHVGPISAVDELRLTMHRIAADGTWLPGPFKIALSAIHRVEFGGPYLAAFEKYAPPR